MEEAPPLEPATAPATRQDTVSTALCLVFGITAAALSVVMLTVSIVANASGWLVSLLTLVMGAFVVVAFAVLSMVFARIAGTSPTGASLSTRIASALGVGAFAIVGAMIVFWIAIAVTAS